MNRIGLAAAVSDRPIAGCFGDYGGDVSERAPRAPHEGPALTSRPHAHRRHRAGQRRRAHHHGSREQRRHRRVVHEWRPHAQAESDGGQSSGGQGGRQAAQSQRALQARQVETGPQTAPRATRHTPAATPPGEGARTRRPRERTRSGQLRRKPEACCGHSLLPRKRSSPPSQ